MRSRFSDLVGHTLAVVFSGCLLAEAQRAELELRIDDGTRTWPIARFVDGQWVASESCVPANTFVEARGRRERVTVTGNAALQTVRAVEPGGVEWLRLAPAILELFDRREREDGLTPNRTAGAPRVVDWIYAVEAEAGRTYYFEASRRIAGTPDVDADTDPPGTLRVSVAGFLRDARERPASLGTKSELRWEQDGLPAGPSRPDLTPLAVLRHSGRSLWLMKRQSGGITWFPLYELEATTTRTVLTVRPVRC